MRVLLCVFLFVISEAKKKIHYLEEDEENPVPKVVDVFPPNVGQLAVEAITHFKPILPINPIHPNITSKDIKAREMLRKKYKRFKRHKNLFKREMSMPTYQTMTNYKWYNFADTQRRNSMLSALVKGKNKLPMIDNFARPRPGSTFRRFGDSNNAGGINWTTCEQFAVGAVFSPQDIVGIDWVPFYVWSVSDYSSSVVHRFKNPTTETIIEYKDVYNWLMNKTIDWDQPKLLMEGMTEMLLIATNEIGLYDAIPKHEVPDSIKEGTSKRTQILPSITLRLKIENPYLVMTFCDEYFATVMAINGTEPTNSREMVDEAQTINFVGTGRPVWRYKEAEEEKERILKERAKVIENDKMIKVSSVNEHLEEFYDYLGR